MERSSFWIVNSVYPDLKEFHFSSLDFNFIAYYKNDTLLFVLDNTCNYISPNNLLFIESDGNIKWDSILKEKFKIDPMKIRPKENTKYKKLDVNYVDLRIFEDFVKNESDDLYNSILFLREDLSLKNAFIRESENLLTYNKTCKTLETSPETLEKLQKKLLNLSSKLQRNQKMEDEGEKPFDIESKNQLIQKLYDNTEKLKNTERRIKRAKKRQEISKEELVKIREHIELLKQKIALRKTGKVDDLQEKQELLTLENFNARNQQEEKKDTKQKEYLEESMAKFDLEKKIEAMAEFKPPVFGEPKQKDSVFKKLSGFVDNLFKNKKDKSVKVFADVKEEKKRDISKVSLLGSLKTKTALRYLVLLIVVLLIITLGIFVFSGNNESNIVLNEETKIVEVLDDTNTLDNKREEIQNDLKESGAVEFLKDNSLQTIEKKIVDIPTEDKSDVAVNENILAEVPVAEVQADKDAMVVLNKEDEMNDAIDEEDSVDAKTDEMDVNKEKLIYKTDKKEFVQQSVVNIAKTEVKKDVKVIETRKEIKPVKVSPKIKAKSVAVNKVGIAVKKTEVLQAKKIKENNLEKKDKTDVSDAVVKLTELDIARKGYVDLVLSGERYLKLLDTIEENFFVNSEKVDFRVLYETNQVWNKFRNLSYAEYYNEDETLRDDVNEQEYSNDEYLLRLYVNAYNKMFETIVNDFVNKYEYANGTGVDLYGEIETSLNDLGKPMEKFAILEKIYERIKTAGGVDEIIKSIEEKESVDLISQGNIEEVRTLDTSDEVQNVENFEKTESESVVMDKKEEVKEMENEIPVENVDSIPVSVINEDYAKQDVVENEKNVDVSDNMDKVIEEQDSDAAKDLENADEIVESNAVSEQKEDRTENLLETSDKENSTMEEVEYITEDIEGLES